MKRSFILAIAASAMMVMGIAPVQAAQLTGLKSMNAALAGQSSIVEKTQARRRGGWRRGGWRGGRGRWRGGRRGAAIGAGIALGVLGAAAAYNSHYYYNDHRRQCRRWRRWCRNGSDRACWRYDRRC